MPSMHTRWAVWTAVVLGAFVWTKWWQRLLLLAHPVMTIAVIIATGNHYVLDAFAGVSYCIAAAVIVGAVTALRTPPPQPHPPMTADRA